MMSNPIKIPVSYFELSPSSQFDLNYSAPKHALLQKIVSSSIDLGAIAVTKDGIIQSKIGDELFLTNKVNTDCKKLLVGRNISRYQIGYAGLWVDYRPDEMMRIEIERGGGGLRLRDRTIFERPKILTRQTADEIIAAYDNQQYYYANTLHGTTITDDSYHPHYVLGVLNSKITTWFYRSSTDEGGKVFAQVKIEILRKLPIPEASPQEQKPLVTLAEKIFKAKQLNANSDTTALENEIDQLVYALYDLTPEEIAIVEGKAAQVPVTLEGEVA